MTITKAERAELRSIVRQQFKVLRHEVEQRGVELLGDVEQEIAAKYREEDEAWGRATFVTNEALLEANRKVNDVFRELLGDAHREKMYVGAHLPEQPVRHRLQLRHEAKTRLEARVKAALLQLDRQEADLLRNLAMGAIESDEARAFLTSIPSVGELVPAARLAELEASLGGEE